MKTSMSGRISAVVSDESYAAVKEFASQERRSLSQMTAILVEEAIAARLLARVNQQVILPSIPTPIPTATTPTTPIPTTADTPTVEMPTTDKRKAK